MKEVNLEIIKNGKLNEVISQKDFNVGETVLFICCEEKSTPDKYTIQIDTNYHILDPIVKHINHSFDPNVKVEGHSLIALRKIKKGNAILRNYYDTEEIIIKEFTDRETGERVNTKNLYTYKYGEDGLLFNTKY
jgi:hypothetical protein